MASYSWSELSSYSWNRLAIRLYMIISKEKNRATKFELLCLFHKAGAILEGLPSRLEALADQGEFDPPLAQSNGSYRLMIGLG